MSPWRHSASVHRQIIRDPPPKTNDTGLGFREKPGLLFSGVLMNYEVNMSAYEDGCDATGAEAYAAYGRESAPVFRRIGREIVSRRIPSRHGHRGR